MYAMERATIRKLVFSEPDHIIDNVYLGPEGSAIDLEYLRSKNIDRVIVAAAYTEARFPQDIDYLKLDIDDSPDEDLYRFFQTAIDFITKSPSTNVLVHCVSGISRSGALVIAYLMQKHSMSLDEAWAFTKARRSCVHPNSGF
jgi:protein-tyrosine phosphatase